MNWFPGFPPTATCDLTFCHFNSSWGLINNLIYVSFNFTFYFLNIETSKPKQRTYTMSLTDEINLDSQNTVITKQTTLTVTGSREVVLQ